MPNEEQIRAWNEVNAPRFVRMRSPMQRAVEPFGRAAMDALEPLSGASVLDVGCGFGETTTELARRAGPGGSVLGVDICEPFLDVARSEATGPVEYLLADAQTHDFGRSFDRVYSRFGAMFFDDPPAAFANLRRALRAGGRFAIVVWGRPEDNPWVHVPLRVVRKFVPVPPRAPGPGPFSLADEATLRRLLEGARFVDVRIEPLELPLFAGATVEEASSFALQLGPAAAALREAGASADIVEQIRSALAEELRKFRTPRGVELGARALLATGE